MPCSEDNAFQSFSRRDRRLKGGVLLVGHLLSAKALMLPCSGFASVWIAHERFGKMSPMNCRRKRYGSLQDYTTPRPCHIERVLALRHQTDACTNAERRWAVET
ncbi:hypothetical protein OH76DRAFT_1401574 [Lentinus brumalis]|uniref:Uncharacterized protein n=1 Tax=Lentinus brumalis TaxID=2498619 RepID=A0A371DFF8_9APHY|nr:hypothetical protein OH76DRAFT_1401574 [Polyporus brumalis]